MNNKISLQDLALGLAKRKKMTRKEAESFIRKVFEVIEERVITDGVVKVKGLGTFKLNTVDSRESVNVATGERFIIDTHSRISFAPHPTLRDAVNRPFSDFETEVISDDVKTEEMEFIPETPAEETSAPVEEASEHVVEPEPAPVVEPAPIADEPKEEPVPEATAQSNKRSKTAIILGVLAVVVLCVLFFIWHPNKLAEDTVVEVTEEAVVAQAEPVAEEAPATEEQPAPAPEEQPAPAPVEDMLTPEEAAEKYPQVEGGEYLIVGTKVKYTLRKGDDLFKLSVGVYGDKKFAPYIVVYNDIKDPSLLLIGDVLKLPELRKKE